jgi:hypothetical protein
VLVAGIYRGVRRLLRSRGSRFIATREHIVRALTKELLIRRTMTGIEVDEVIVTAVATKSAEHERQPRAAMRTRNNGLESPDTGA